jgi:glycosyltransferase involved in cell wall biosynthesis
MSAPFPDRIAVVHDWLIDYAGSERVLAQILRCFPQADVFTLVDRMPAAERAFLGARRPTTSFLQRMPAIASRLEYYLPLMPLAVEQLDVTGYDLVISSSHAVAKGVIVAPDCLHLSYVHSPMRYAWDLQFAYLRGAGLERGLRGAALRWVLHRLRQWDRNSAAGVDHFIANSRFVARRILKAYRRDAEVIYPPVDVDFYRPASGREDYYVTVSRLMAYKGVDLLLEAFARMPQRRLVVIGDGPEYRGLKARAGANIQFTGWLPATELRSQVQRARAFLFAAVEDFGIAPVEALACGTPVVALRKGGAAETLVGLEGEDPTGVFFDQQSAHALVRALNDFEAQSGRISEAACRRRAERFSAERFREELSAYVARRFGEWRAKIDPC